jgi:uncharacterized protein YkwD
VIRAILTHSYYLLAVATGLTLAGCLGLSQGASHPTPESLAADVSTPTVVPTTAALRVTSPAPTRESLSPDEATMLAAINRQRRAVRCPVLIPETRLMALARVHAAEIAERREASHRSADGATLAQRLERGGYPAARHAELIAVSQAAPAAIVATWAEEPLDGPHRRELENCFYSEMGIGMARTDAGIAYWVIVVAMPA